MVSMATKNGKPQCSETKAENDCVQWTVCRGQSRYEAEVVAVRAKKKLKAEASDANPIGKSELAARIKSRSHHHVDRGETERSPERARDKARRALYCETRQDKTCY
jgi:hypothetical protein